MFSRVLSALFRPRGKPDLYLELLRESNWGVGLGYLRITCLLTGTKVWPGAKGVEEVCRHLSDPARDRCPATELSTAVCWGSEQARDGRSRVFLPVSLILFPKTALRAGKN